MATRHTAAERERFGLMWALGVSVLLHLLLLLFTVWFPVGASSAGLVVHQQPDDTITFSFDREAEATTDDPLEDAPFTPVEPQDVQPTPSPPVPETEPSTPSEAVPPEPISPEQIEQEAVLDEPLDEPVELPDPDPDPEEAAEESGVELPVEDPAVYSDLPPLDAPAEPRQAEPRQIDVRKALRDFQRSMANRPRPPASAGSGPPTNVVMPDLAEVPFTGFGMGNLVFESRDFDWSDYGRQIYMAIWRAWHNRLWQTTDEFEKWAHQSGNWMLHHMSQVRFVIEHNGQVTGIVLEAGAGCSPLDASAVDALAEVILPPLPEAFPRDREVVHARFLADGHIRNMRPTLRYKKNQGYF